MRSRAGFGGYFTTVNTLDNLAKLLWVGPLSNEQLQCFESLRGILEALTKCLSHDVSLMKVGRGSAQCRAALRSDRCVVEPWASVMLQATSERVSKGQMWLTLLSKGQRTLCTNIGKLNEGLHWVEHDWHCIVAEYATNTGEEGGGRTSSHVLSHLMMKCTLSVFCAVFESSLRR